MVNPVKSAKRTYFISSSQESYRIRVVHVQEFHGTSLYVNCGRFSIMAEKIHHPRGLSTLFFTEMWERFSYYGMRAFLILYMTAPVTAGGLGFTDVSAGRIYGLYTGSVWFSAVLGGVVADIGLGQYRRGLLGGIIIAARHFTLAFKDLPFFFTGLGIIVIRTRLLKAKVH